MAGKRTRRYKKRRSFKKGYKRRGTKPTKRFAKKVQKIIDKNAETKQSYVSLTGQSFNSGINATGDISSIIPLIQQGIGDNQRIGDVIRATKLTIKGAIVYNPSTGQYGTYANARLGVRMMIVQPKNFADVVNVQNNATSWLPYLLKKGGVAVGFTGVLSDLWAPINTDAVTKYYDKVFYLQGPYQSTAAGSIQMLDSTKFFSKTISFRGAGKMLRYDAGTSSGLLPSMWAPVLLIGYSHMDNSAVDTLTTAIQLSYDATLSYKDV